MLNKMNLKRLTPRHLIIKIPKIKDKERTLKAARKKQLVTYKGAPIRMSADFSTETWRPEGVARNIHSDEKQIPTTQQSYHLESKER